MRTLKGWVIFKKTFNRSCLKKKLLNFLKSAVLFIRNGAVFLKFIRETFLKPLFRKKIKNKCNRN